MNEAAFYSQLRPLKLPLTALLREEHFHDVPASWHIIISDVKNSTQAVNAGRHNDVNLVAAGSLIAALNVARKYGVEVPFFFGGDGGTLLVPEQLLPEVLGGLAAHNRNSQKTLGLQMHIGSLSVKELWDSGHSIRIAKLEIDSVYSKAVTIGDGLRYAEQRIKQIQREESDSLLQAAELNLTGLECRWNKIKPPVDEAENVCYLIEALETAKQLPVYTDVLQTMESIYGDAQKRNPLSTEQLKPLFGFRKLKREMMVKFGRWRLGYFLEAWLRTFFGKFYFKYDWNIGGLRGKEYLQQLIAHADTLTVDGRVNTIICGTQKEHERFLNYLAQKEKEGALIYGHHASKESVMTCYIENRNSKHIHFVDGADGGYTEASKEFKAKLKQRERILGH